MGIVWAEVAGEVEDEDEEDEAVDEQEGLKPAPVMADLPASRHVTSDVMCPQRHLKPPPSKTHRHGWQEELLPEKRK